MSLHFYLFIQYTESPRIGQFHPQRLSPNVVLVSVWSQYSSLYTLGIDIVIQFRVFFTKLVMHIVRGLSVIVKVKRHVFYIRTPARFKILLKH